MVMDFDIPNTYQKCTRNLSHFVPCLSVVLSRFVFSASSILGLVFLREKHKLKEFASKFMTTES